MMNKFYSYIFISLIILHLIIENFFSISISNKFFLVLWTAFIIFSMIWIVITLLNKKLALKFFRFLISVVQ